MTRTVICMTTFALAVLLSPSSMAQTNQGNFTYAPEERFAMAAIDNGESTSNVVIQQAAKDDLPGYIKYQVNLVAKDCFGSEESAEKIDVYTYVSDKNRKDKLAPNYILDLTSLNGTQSKACFFGNVCVNDMCGLIGFKAVSAEGWSLNFQTLASAWSVSTKKDASGEKPIQTMIDISTPADDNCTSTKGKLSDDEKLCSRPFVWRSHGLVGAD
ncbi:MAG: hypothetical protein PHX43_08350 [Alphaproteobacteria bacterium]|nr:hypothetical protein [Alphaproteobacteria bacterium]